MIDTENTTLIIIDVQEKLIPVIHDQQKLIGNLKRLIEGARVLGLPILLTEQCPEKIGQTIPDIKNILTGVKPIIKKTFSCMRNDDFIGALEKIKRDNVIVAGVETHVCVYQTAAMLVEAGYQVQVVADCVASRAPENKAIGLERIKLSGATLSSLETALLELQQIAEGDRFKAIMKLLK